MTTDIPPERNLQQLISAMISNVPGDDYIDKLHHLNNCKCCTRHQINKPCIFSRWIDTDESSTISNIPNCTCNCRHIARFICRRAPFRPPSPDSTTTNL